MTELIDTTEMYLRTVLELEEEGIPPMRARIVERLDHSGPTVSQTVSRMERDGLLTVQPDRRLALTEAGRETAVKVMRKHRLAERLLADVIGLDLSVVHDEACRWEHVMSEAVEERLVDLLHNPQISPYGMPIPGLAGLGAASEEAAHQALLQPLQSLPGTDQILSEAAPSELGGRFVLRGIPEVVQTHPEVLSLLGRCGLLAGGPFAARKEESGEVVLRALEPVEGVEAEDIRIPEASAHSIVVGQG